MSRGGSGTGELGRTSPRASSALPLVTIALLLVLGAAPPTLGAPHGARAAGTVGLSLTAQPLTGSAPLFVDLRATLTPASLAATYNWSFGDGTYFQESARSYSEVTHEFALAGAFVTNVSVVSTQGGANASLTVVVLPGGLAVAISADPTTGAVPLTVHFGASASGGSGTFLGIRWSFGDGGNGSGPNLDYTYVSAGNFTATLSVTDSAGRMANTTVEIRATPSATPKPSGDIGGPTPLEAAALPLAIALAAFAGMALAYRWLVVRRSSAEPLTAPIAAISASAVQTGPSEPPGPPSPEEMADTSDARPGSDDARRLSERILVHLYWYGRPTSEGVAPPDASQAGMARRLGVAQNSLSKALGRLMDAGAVRVELRHVSGAPRRLKTYSLTSRGESVARTIRAESGEGRGRP